MANADGDGRCGPNSERDAWETETRRNAYAPSAADGTGGRPRLTDQNLPVYEGVVHVELGAEPVPYRIIATADDVMEEREFHALAVSTCRVACLAADVIRGKLASSALKRAVTAPCLKRLETLAYLIDNQMRRNIELRARMRYLPVIPHDVSGMLVSETSMEMVVKLSIGGTVYWSTIRLKRIGCRWMCVVVDMG
ncbi:hypothetical protein JS528_00760 [Bifidobacterium sp. MA2]|uniref:Uncharacterized protein n=1 Tax=Bifidobacterium santillanense TaxID=2809028 RepID=A0ABS5ULX1_9BIFI|nr:Rv3235 family protein [Bifidobacterium santillanense]MBT1171912.1 hypothetical protein [Bifidobacterium santillanense]